MTTGLTPSEIFVASLCERAFLRLWTHPNPIGKKGKELCDCLIVFGPHIIILSVKESEYRDTDDKTGMERWHRNAVDESVEQIYGAERWLMSVDQFQRKDGRTISLPPSDERKIHRLSVSLGGKGKVFLRWGDFGNGIVHVLDEQNLVATFSVLDTAANFIDYLAAVENLFERNVRLIFDGGGPEDLLAMFFMKGASFGFIKEDQPIPDQVIVLEGIWKSLTSSEEFKAHMAARKDSYSWDNLIEMISKDLLAGDVFDLYSKKVSKDELALIAMARQPRGDRMNLGEQFLQFLQPKSKQVRARVVRGANRTAFVFLAGSSSDRERRSQELGLRCYMVRGLCKEDIDVVVGLATDRPEKGKEGYSFDIVYWEQPIWTSNDDKHVGEMQKELGYFLGGVWKKG